MGGREGERKGEEGGRGKEREGEGKREGGGGEGPPHCFFDKSNPGYIEFKLSWP